MVIIMGFIDNIKKVFSTPAQTKEISPGSFNLVKKLFGQQWEDSEYLETYRKSLYVHACISKIAEKVASVEFGLNKIKNSKGEVERIENHEILDLLSRFNPFHTKAEFLEMDIINRKSTGDSFIYKVRNRQGKPVELWNIRPDLVTIKGSSENYIDYYEVYNSETGKKERIEPEDMIHIKYPSPLEEYFGMSPLSSAQKRVDTEEYASYYQSNFFLNQARPDAIIEIDRPLTKEQKNQMVDGWEKRHKGEGKNSKIGILSGGKYHQVSLSQREMDFIESMRFTRDDILVAFGVPKPIVSITDDVNLANAKIAQEIFLNEVVVPEVKRFVDKINEELIIPDFGEEYILTFEDPVPVDREVKLREFEAGIDRWITINEVRKEMNLDPIKGGDKLFRPLSSVPVSEGGNVVDRQDFKNLRGRMKLRIKMKFKDQIMKDIKNEAGKVVKGEEKAIKSNSLFKDESRRKIYWEFRTKDIDKKSERIRSLSIGMANKQMDRFLNKFSKEKPKTKREIRKIFNRKEENKTFKESMLPLITSLFKESGREAISLLTDKPFNMEKTIKAGGRIEEYLAYRAMFFANSVNETTLLGLTKTLSKGIEKGESIPKLRNRVKKGYKEFSDYRAERIARTETTSVVNKAHEEAYKQSGVVKGKEWIATLDDRVRDSHLMMDGEQVKLGEVFSNGLEAPSEPNCRCTIAPITRMAE